MAFTEVVKEYETYMDQINGINFTDGLPVNWSFSVLGNAVDSFGLRFHKKDYSNVVDKTYIEIYALYITKYGSRTWKSPVYTGILVSSLGGQFTDHYFDIEKKKKCTSTTTVKVVFTAYAPVKTSVPPSFAGYDLSEKSAFDKILLVGKQKFFVNKAVLSLYSPFFDNLFNNANFEESKKEEIELKELDAKEFDILLKVLYPTNVAINAKNVEFLWKLADRFDIKSVALMCQSYVCSLQDVESEALSLATRMRMAQAYKSEKLMATLLPVAMKNMKL